jgi:WD40 repeat protein
VTTSNLGNVVPSPDNRTAAIFAGGRFRIVDLDGGQVRHEGDAASASTAAFAPDGGRLVVGDANGGVRILDVDTGAWFGPPRVGHNGFVSSATYSPDGSMFVTGADDAAIVFWDARTGAPLTRMLPGRPADGPATPRFRSDGHTLVMASPNGAIYTMDTRPKIGSTSPARSPVATLQRTNGATPSATTHTVRPVPAGAGPSRSSRGELAHADPAKPAIVCLRLTCGP